MPDPHEDTPQGPADPHGEGGIDAPAPPGGPQRSDAPAGGTDHDTGPEPERHAPVTPSEHDDEPRTEQPERDLQQENAETSMDQPSQ